MAETIGEAIGKGFERVLRWLYPGALFLILLAVSWPDFYNLPIVTTYGLTAIIVVGLTAGFITYLVQAYVLKELLVWVTKLIRWDVTLLRLPPDPIRFCFLRWLAKTLCNPWAEAITKRWPTRKELDGYLHYSFAAFHAMMITAWLPPLFRFLLWATHEPLLPFWTKWPCWWILSLVTGLFGLFLYLYLTRLDWRELPESLASHTVNR